MKNNKKDLSQNVTFTLSKGSSPYKLYRAPEPIFNADDKLKQQWFIQRQRQQQANIQKLQTVGQFDKIAPMIIKLYQDITNIRNFIEDSKSYPFVQSEHVQTMNSIQSSFDQMNNTIISKIIPQIDTLGFQSKHIK